VPCSSALQAAPFDAARPSDGPAPSPQCWRRSARSPFRARGATPKEALRVDCVCRCTSSSYFCAGKHTSAPVRRNASSGLATRQLAVPRADPPVDAVHVGSVGHIRQRLLQAHERLDLKPGTADAEAPTLRVCPGRDAAFEWTAPQVHLAAEEPAAPTVQSRAAKVPTPSSRRAAATSNQLGSCADCPSVPNGSRRPPHRRLPPARWHPAAARLLRLPLRARLQLRGLGRTMSSRELSPCVQPQSDARSGGRGQRACWWRAPHVVLASVCQCSVVSALSSGSALPPHIRTSTPSSRRR
jgi:hypothetical protein